MPCLTALCDVSQHRELVLQLMPGSHITVFACIACLDGGDQCLVVWQDTLVLCSLDAQLEQMLCPMLAVFCCQTMC